MLLLKNKFNFGNNKKTLKRKIISKKKGLLYTEKKSARKKTLIKKVNKFLYSNFLGSKIFFNRKKL